MSLLDDLLAGLNNEQRAAVTERARDVVVTAGAGSGKTRALVARYLSLLAEGQPPRAVAAITFTEKAAREMRRRVRTAVEEWLATDDVTETERDRWAPLLTDIEAARIGTIHGLCAAILRAHPAEAGVDPRFDVLDERQSAVLRAQVVAGTLDWAADQTEMGPLFVAFGSETVGRVVARLLERRLDVAEALRAPDAGNGWREAILAALRVYQAAAHEEIAHLQLLVDSADLEADAGEKLFGQVRGLLMAWDEFENHLAGDEPIAAAQSLFTLRREHLKRGAGKKNSLAKTAVAALQASYDAGPNPWLGGAKSSDPAPSGAAAFAALGPALESIFTHATAIYQRERDRRGALDFDDLEGRAAEVMQLEDVRARWQKQIEHVLVDEFQDTNARQVAIVEALAGARPGCLFVVGDAKQSIYRFRAADVTVFRRMDADVQARGGLPVVLDETFRPHAALLAVLNPMLQYAMRAEDDGPQPDYAVPFAPLRAHRKSPDLGLDGQPVEFVLGQGDNAAAARPVAASALAARLQELHDQNELAWSDVALLFAASTNFGVYEDALEAAGIPYVTVAGRGFYDRPEVRDLLNALRALAEPWQDLALAGFLRSPLCGLSDVALYQLRWPDAGGVGRSFRSALHADLGHLSPDDQARAAIALELLESLHPLVERLPVAQLLQRLLLATNYPALLATSPSGARMLRNVEKLLADAEASGAVRVGDFLEYIAALRDAGTREGEAPPDETGAVRLMTVYKAKGLEFPVVVIADAARKRPSRTDAVLVSTEFGLVPGPELDGARPLAYRLARAQESAKEDAEDLRLLYVAATRAREKLLVNGHLTDRRPSGWLGILLAAAGLAPDTLIPGEWQVQEIPGTDVRVSALLSVEATATGATLAARISPEEGQGAALFAPIPSDAGDAYHNELRTKIAAPQQGVEYGMAVGRLVHAALERWVFPGDPACMATLRAAATQMNLPAAGREGAIEQTEILLSRLRADARFEELDNAERHHEVPFRLPKGSAGRIDLLYRTREEWRIVDFKTEPVSDDDELETLVSGNYGEQIRWYQSAASNLAKEPFQAELCFLDAMDGVVWRTSVDGNIRI